MAERKAEVLVESILFHQQASDPVSKGHSPFIHTAFLYTDVKTAIKWEDGQHIIRHEKWWLTMFLGTGKSIMHYAKEAVLLTSPNTFPISQHIIEL